MKRRPTTPPETLRALRDAEAAKAAESALRTGEISEEQGDALNRLARLVELEDARTPTWRSRAPVVAVAVTTLVVVSVLFFARVASTDVELDVDATRVSFALPTRQTVTDMLPLSRLGVGRLREAEIPRSRDHESHVLRSDEDDVAVQVAPATIADRQGTVTLEGLLLPPGTVVSVTHAGAATIPSRDAAAAPDLHVALSGPTDLSASGASRRTLDFDVPSDLTLHAGKNGLFFDVSLQEGARGALARQSPPGTFRCRTSTSPPMATAPSSGASRPLSRARCISKRSTARSARCAPASCCSSRAVKASCDPSGSKTTAWC